MIIVSVTKQIRLYIDHVLWQVLEDIGMYKKIKRYAGSSAGAMTASLLAVGYNSHEIEEFLSQDLSKIFLGMYYVETINLH